MFQAQWSVNASWKWLPSACGSSAAVSSGVLQQLLIMEKSGFERTRKWTGTRRTQLMRGYREESTMPEVLHDIYLGNCGHSIPLNRRHGLTPNTPTSLDRPKSSNVCLPVGVSLASWSEPLNAGQGGRWKRECADVWKVDKGDSYLIIKNLTCDTSIYLWARRLMEADLMWLISLELKTAGREWKVDTPNY